MSDSRSVSSSEKRTGPVTFYRDTDRPVQPYYVSPWQAEPAAEMPAADAEQQLALSAAGNPAAGHVNPDESAGSNDNPSNP